MKTSPGPVPPPRLSESLARALDALAAGRLIVVTDDEDRENEGDLVLAAEKATPESVNVMIRDARGLICVPMTDARTRHLGIGDMTPRNRESHGTAFTVSVDAADGITTGISAFDRARTIRLLADAATRPEDLVQPGHVFPLRARPGGVLERAGHTEASIDLVLMAGLSPCAVICEILNEDGTMARREQLRAFAERHGFPLVTVAEVIAHRLRSESLVERVDRRPFPLLGKPFEFERFRNRLDGRTHAALVLGDPTGEEPVLARIHAGSLPDDVFAAFAEGHPIGVALRAIAARGRGVLVYLEGEADGAGTAPARARTADAVFRGYGVGAQVLRALGVRRVQLLTRTPRRLAGLEAFGLEIAGTSWAE